MNRTEKRQKKSILLLCLFLLVIVILQLLFTLARPERNYLELVCAASREFEVPVSLVLAVIRTESNFRKNSVSEAGAMGLMQLLPETFLFLAEEKLEEKVATSDLFDPSVNIRYGTYYLSYLYDRFGDWQTALAAYNAGEGHVAEWLEDPALSQNGTLTNIPFAETKEYVKKVSKAYARYSQKYE